MRWRIVALAALLVLAGCVGGTADTPGQNGASSPSTPENDTAQTPPETATPTETRRSVDLDESPRTNASIDFVNCTAVIVDGVRYERVELTGVGGVASNYSGNYSGMVAFQANETVSETLVIGGENGTDASNLELDACLGTPTPTPTPTATPSPSG